MSAGRAARVKIRASEAERAEWHAKARSAGLTLSDLVRRSVGRVRTWTWRTPRSSASAPVRSRASATTSTRPPAWANTHRGAVEAVEVTGHLIAIERALATMATVVYPDSNTD